MHVSHAGIMFYSATTSMEKKKSMKTSLYAELVKNKNPVKMSDCMKEGRIT